MQACQKKSVGHRSVFVHISTCEGMCVPPAELQALIWGWSTSLISL